MNQRKHWTWTSKQKRMWRETAYLIGLLQVTEYEKIRKPGKATIHTVFPVTQNRRRDPHNYYPTVKPIVDGLVDAGFWPDDTPEFIETREPVFYKGDLVFVVID